MAKEGSLQLLKWMFVLFLLVANCGFWLFCFNQINATGWPRKTVKTGTKIFVAACFLLPPTIAVLEFSSLAAWLGSPSEYALSEFWPAQAPLFCCYGAWCLASGIVLGACFLESRLWLRPARQLLREESQDFRLREHIQPDFANDSMTRFAGQMPGNQIGEIRVNRKQLRVARNVPGVEDLRIGHISDLHMTGQFHPDHYRFVLGKFMELEPNIIFIAGDIIDYDHCLPWISELLEPLRAQYGVYFVLGNHDRRVEDQPRLLDSLGSLGFFDLGCVDHHVTLDSGSSLTLIGNELPWYERHERETLASASGDSSFRIGLSHSPDQFAWAQEQGLDLLLAGHTHGGQIRIPGIGPLVAPSHYGSRYASGVFFREPTLMHVSRGVAGTHPFRWWCKPEVSLLTLTTHEA